MNVASCTSTSAPGRELDDGVARDGVAGQDHGTPGTCGADELVGRHRPTVGERDGLASQERSALRAVRHVELGRKRRVEDSGASVLHECPCDGVAAMPYRPGHESVAVSLDDISVLHLARLDLEAQSTDERSEHAQKVAQARRPDELERALPAMEVVGLEQAGKPEHVIGVVVGEGDQVELGQPERRAQELALGPLTAVDEQDVALAPDGASPTATGQPRAPIPPCRGR